jgi:hypothetical protein
LQIAGSIGQGAPELPGVDWLGEVGDMRQH